MKKFTLFLGDSKQDEEAKQLVSEWLKQSLLITVHYESVHTNPSTVVRLGITQLPALVLEEEIIAQGALEQWVLTLLLRMF